MWFERKCSRQEFNRKRSSFGGLVEGMSESKLTKKINREIAKGSLKRGHPRRVYTDQIQNRSRKGEKRSTRSYFMR